MSGKLWFPLTFKIYCNSIAIIIGCSLYAKYAESLTRIISFNLQNNWWARYSYYLILQRRNLKFREIKLLSPRHRWRVAELGFEFKSTDFIITLFGFPQAASTLIYNQGIAMSQENAYPSRPHVSVGLASSFTCFTLHSAIQISPSKLIKCLPPASSPLNPGRKLPFYSSGIFIMFFKCVCY